MSPVQSQEHNPLPEHPPAPELRARVEQGGATKYHEANAGKGKLFARERVRLLVDEGSFVEDGVFANVAAEGPAGRRRRHRHGDHRRAPGRADGQRLDGEGRLLGRADRREDHPDHRDGVPDRRADGLPGRLGRRADHRPDRPVPRPARRREDLLEPGPRQRLDPAGVRAVRPVGGRRCLHPGVLRRGRDGRGQRVDVPRLGPDGRDGHRREDHPRGDGRCPGALRRVRASGTSWSRPSRRPSRRCAAYLSYLPSNWQGTPPSAESRPAPANVDLAALVPASERQAFDMRRYAKGLLDEGVVLRDPRAVGPRGHGRLRPARRRGRRRRRQQLDVQGRRAVHRLRRQGHPVRAALRRVQRAAGVPLRRPGLHGRLGGREGRASSGTARR